MKRSNVHHIVIGDATHPDCEICKRAAAGELTLEHFMPMPPMNRAARRALRKWLQKGGGAVPGPTMPSREDS